LGKDADSVMHARVGIFWGREDKLNVYKPVEPLEGTTTSLPLAELEAVNLALRQVNYFTLIEIYLIFRQFTSVN
jgi:hypothetical protein